MKAIVCHRYGAPEALQVEDVDKPTPVDDQVQIQVHAAALNALDWHLMKGRPRIGRLFSGLRRPRISRPGHDVAGRVEAVGRSVTRFKPGDEVFGACRGSLAEYACATEAHLATKPANVSFEDAAAVPVAGLTALQGLRDHGRIQPGQRVLINGAAGGVGTFAVQIAKALGAHVTGVCGTGNLDLVGSIGADSVMDYSRADFTRGGQRYDLILDLVANHSFFACCRVLNPRGMIVAAGGGGADGRAFGRRLVRTLTGALISRFGSRRMALFVARLNHADLARMGELLASRQVTPVIDRRHPLNQASEAFRRLATGHARGKIVVTMLTALLVAAPALVRCETLREDLGGHRTFAFSPDRPERCDYFWVTEFNTSVTGVNSQDAGDHYLFTDALGLMRNIDRTRAVGVSVDAHLTGGAFRFTPTLRFKQWLAGRSSIDLTLGYAHSSIVQEGVAGPIADLRYSPNAWFHVQAGACRIRNVTSIFYLPDYQVNETTRLQLYAGAGLGGAPGVASWGAQVIGFAALVAALSGMD
jgi:NADPH:quinone reductase-like Zn-dependent oxidoreductase